MYALGLTLNTLRVLKIVHQVEVRPGLELGANVLQQQNNDSRLQHVNGQLMHLDASVYCLS